ncbi:MAG: DUF3021 domain-containing protein [Solobacterium sp.]|jgi:hypothetical protein|nr:DUF3021 domain-containing protein [Solobacterium sp.]MCH4204796.1 DUF3021 domain-containing protein [Solobacterium sp.]MCH4226420.1 DUF3021 domain-containing protein [Solobacterium sp.]MCH4282410.1 DUF3021 domain-containing protein [Solobacterium sp.]
MKKEMKHLILIGAPCGVMIYVFLIIIISLLFNWGMVISVPGKLAVLVKNELNAFITIVVYSMICGSIWACASLIWKNDRWSLTKQTVIHFIICTVSAFPIAYCFYRISNAKEMLVVYFISFVVIYLSVWMYQYISLKQSIKKINRFLSNDH